MWQSSFCGLNDHRNLALSIKYARKAGMISQAALSITHSPLHTVDYYMGVVDKMANTASRARSTKIYMARTLNFLFPANTFLKEAGFVIFRQAPTSKRSPVLIMVQWLKG